MELIEIMKVGSSVYSGMSMNHTIFIGHKGVWRAYQSVLCYFPFKNAPKSCSVSTKNLTSVLSKLSDAKCDFQENFILITKDNISVELPYATTNKSDMGIFKTLQKSISSVKEWSKLPANFEACVQACSKTVSSNAIHGTLSCFSIFGKNMYTSNNISLSVATMESEFDTCLVDSHALLGCLAIKPIEYSVINGKHILFRNEEKAVVQISIVNGSYPDFGEIAGLECKKYINFDGHSLEKIAGISESFFEGTDMFDNTLKAVVKDGKMKIENSADAGKITAEIDVDFEEDFSFTIDSKTLQLLNNTDTKIGIEEGKIIIKSEKLKIISSLGL